ncbi:hypothetical protein [Vibrio gallaecicus]|uniref:hypothetical protein n=1 Tax=Vibrio gallaecicus TaxID=552386 RepID=UPI0010CA01DC|nr:hypothetical protein [Vibrio gallaecicus]MDN3617169.1 hypothetical protein [Vibrio gallaecicus]
MTKSIKTIIYSLICFAVLVTSIRFATYFSVFNGGLSTDSSDWANLGSYIGGLTTPVLSFCALIALLFSIYRLCCVIQFRDRAAPYRAFLSQYGKFQAYLTQ